METLPVPRPLRSASQSSVQSSTSDIGESSSKPTKRRVWTTAEDNALREAIGLFGSQTGPGSAWPAISQHVSVHGGRTNKDCRKRWFHTLDPGLKKGKWTRDEDAALRKAFLEVGASWKEMGTFEELIELIVALRVPGRTDEQVAKRWRDVLSPGLNLDAPWTPEEDVLLLRLFKELGPKWTLMSDSFPTRNGIAVRNRFRSLRRSQTTQAGMTPLSEVPSTSSAHTTSSDTPFFSDASQIATNTDMTFLHDILGTSNVDLPQFSSITLDQPGQELFPDPEDAQDQSWFDTFCADHLDRDHALNAVGESADQAFNPDWVDHSTLSSWFATHANDPQPPPLAVSDASVASASTPDTTTAIRNVWGLLMALESGKESMHVSAALIRQLLADAARKGG